MARLALALALVGIVPVGLLAARLIGVNRAAMDDQVEASHVLFARSASEQIGSFISTQILLARGLAGNPALADPRSTEAQILLRENLQAWSGLGVLGVAVVNPQGEQYILAQLAEDDAKARVRRALSAEPDIDVLALPEDPSPLLRTAADLPANAGYVWVVADGREILSSLDTFELGEGTAEVALTTSDGTDIVGTTGGLPADLLRTARTGYLQGTDVSFVDPETQQEQIGAYSPVPNTDWAVISRQPAEIARRVAVRMRRQSQIALALVAASVALLSAFAYWSVVRPIRQLADAQRRLAGLNPNVARGTEIDQLKASFEALEQRLKEQQALDEVFLGRYQILEVLGTGAMGTVFLGRDPRLKRKVAIKTIRLGRQTEPEKRKELISRLVDEAVTTAKFNHANIVAVYDVEETPEAAFLAMEYVDGTNLEQMIWKQGKLDPALVLPLGASIARALAAAHDSGLVHRDVKPANVMLGKDGSIKVTDFGIAQIFSSVAPDSDVVFGTPGYLPPETLQGKGYDRTGDLFSLGAVLYFCLTASRPFEGRTVKDVVRKTLFAVPPPPSRLAASIPPELESLVMSLLNREPAARPGNADDVADRLENMALERDTRWHPPDGIFEGKDPLPEDGEYIPTTRLAAP